MYTGYGQGKVTAYECVLLYFSVKITHQIEVFHILNFPKDILSNSLMRDIFHITATKPFTTSSQTYDKCHRFGVDTSVTFAKFTFVTYFKTQEFTG